MRWSSLLVLLPLTVLAQDPKIAKAKRDASLNTNHQTSLSGAPVSASQASEGGNAYWNAGKKLFKATVLGQVPEEDIAKRDQQDKADGVERLTKETWHRLEEGSPDDVWAILVHGPPRDVIDRQYYATHTNATRISREKSSTMIRKVHWARVDYMHEADICTKWILFRSPVLAIVSDKGKTIRWVPMVIIMQGGEGLHNLLASGGWKNIPVWNSRYAPGGDRAYLIDFYLTSSKWIGAKTSQVPPLVWMGLFAAITQNLIKWMHTKSPKQATPAGVAPQTRPAGSVPAGDGVGDRAEKLREALRERRSKGVKSD